jgi:sugar phosphate isomerase/epimerase
VAVVESFFDRIRYFHLKDTTAEVWQEVGYGQLDFEALFPLIRRRQDWWLVVEQDEVQRPPAESARLSRNYLKQHLGV